MSTYLDENTQTKKEQSSNINILKRQSVSKIANIFENKKSKDVISNISNDIKSEKEKLESETTVDSRPRVSSIKDRLSIFNNSNSKAIAPDANTLFTKKLSDNSLKAANDNTNKQKLINIDEINASIKTTFDYNIVNSINEQNEDDNIDKTPDLKHSNEKIEIIYINTNEDQKNININLLNKFDDNISNFSKSNSQSNLTKINKCISNKKIHIETNDEKKLQVNEFETNQSFTQENVEEKDTKLKKNHSKKFFSSNKLDSNSQSKQDKYVNYKQTNNQNLSYYNNVTLIKNKDLLVNNFDEQVNCNKSIKNCCYNCILF